MIWTHYIVVMLCSCPLLFSLLLFLLILACVLLDVGSPLFWLLERVAERPQSIKSWHSTEIEKSTSRTWEGGTCHILTSAHAKWIFGYPSAVRSVVLFLLISKFSFLYKVRRPSNFVDFYSYAFQYCLTGMVLPLSPVM